LSYCKTHENTTVEDFSIADGTYINGYKVWKESEQSLPLIHIKNDYTFRWQDFRKVSESKGGEFKYLYVEIPPKTES
jgi:hypothetical protein